MKSTLKFLVCAGAAISFATAAQAQFLYTNLDGSATGAIGLSTGTTTASGVAAPTGFEWSEVQSQGGFVNNVAGYGAAGALRVADNFVVPSGQTWTVSSIRFYAYVTGSAPGGNPWTSWTLQITSGNGPANPPALLYEGGADPTPGTTLVFGDTTTNLIGATGPANAVVTDTNLYRVFNTNPGTSLPGTTRLIRQIEVNFTPALSLNAGTYWLNINNSGGFVPTVTIVGQRGKTGSDGVQNIATASTPLPPGTATVVGWNWIRDGGTMVGAPIIQQDLPFVILGTSAGGCYANCDGSTGTPLLTPADFVCFLNKFRAGDPYANCDGSTGTPALTPADFVCFLNKFRAGC